MKHLLAEIARIAQGLLAELTDQNAYRRFLAAHGMEPCGASWRAFQDRRWRAKSRRGRCC
jgi:hypothetical protein